MTTMALLVLFILFFVKHFVCDFPLQAFPYMYLNKGTYGHPGGLLHAGIHGIGTLLILLLFFGPWFALAGAYIDMSIHYHIDWAKMNLAAKNGWKCDNSEYFWIALGLDQMLHYLTYALIIWMLL